MTLPSYTARVRWAIYDVMRQAREGSRALAWASTQGAIEDAMRAHLTEPDCEEPLDPEEIRRVAGAHALGWLEPQGPVQ